VGLKGRFAQFIYFCLRRFAVEELVRIEANLDGFLISEGGFKFVRESKKLFQFIHILRRDIKEFHPGPIFSVFPQMDIFPDDLHNCFNAFRSGPASINRFSRKF